MLRIVASCSKITPSLERISMSPISKVYTFCIGSLIAMVSLTIGFSTVEVALLAAVVWAVGYCMLLWMLIDDVPENVTPEAWKMFLLHRSLVLFVDMVLWGLLVRYISNWLTN